MGDGGGDGFVICVYWLRMMVRVYLICGDGPTQFHLGVGVPQRRVTAASGEGHGLRPTPISRLANSHERTTHGHLRLLNVIRSEVL